MEMKQSAHKYTFVTFVFMSRRNPYRRRHWRTAWLAICQAGGPSQVARTMRSPQP